MAKRNKLSKSSLHWFIKSRPYVLVPELRRRFDLDGTDDVNPIGTPHGRAYIGLPERAARFIEDLVRENRLGLEFVPDLTGRMVQGLYAFDLLRQQTGLVIAPSRSASMIEIEDQSEPAGDETASLDAPTPAPPRIQPAGFPPNQFRSRLPFPPGLSGPRDEGYRRGGNRADSPPASGDGPVSVSSDAALPLSRSPRRPRRDRTNRLRSFEGGQAPDAPEVPPDTP